MSRATRADNRRNHLSDAEITRRASGPVRTLTPEEIINMDPKKPTDTKRILVDELPRTPETIDSSLEKVREAVQSTLNVLHRQATKELHLLDDKELQSLNTISAILVRIKRLGDDAPIDPSKLTDEELAKLA